MKKTFLWVALFSLSSCVNSKMEAVFSAISKIDFSMYKEYGVSDFRQGSLYVIDYLGNEYWGMMPQDCSHFSKLERKYSNREADSLALKDGEDYFREIVATDTKLAENLVGICRVYQSIWQIDPDHLFLRQLFVDEKHNAFLIVIWKPSNLLFHIAVTRDLEELISNYDNFMQEYSDFFLSKGFEYSFIDNYLEIQPGLYYRKD